MGLTARNHLNVLLVPFLSSEAEKNYAVAVLPRRFLASRCIKKNVVNSDHRQTAASTNRKALHPWFSAIPPPK